MPPAFVRETYNAYSQVCTRDATYSRVMNIIEWVELYLTFERVRNAYMTPAHELHDKCNTWVSKKVGQSTQGRSRQSMLIHAFMMGQGTDKKTEIHQSSQEAKPIAACIDIWG